MKMYSIHDSKAMFYDRPFFARTDGEAIRMFSDAINDPKTPISAHYADFTLFCVGEFDEQTGVVSPADSKSLGNGVDFYAGA